MATNRRNAKKSGITPGKLILIGVLAVVLVVVIVLQTGGDTPTTKTNENGSNKNTVARRRKHARVPAQPPQASLTSPRQAIAWPVMTVEEVIAHDPFALPALPTDVAESNLESSSEGSTADQNADTSLARQEEERRLQIEAALERQEYLLAKHRALAQKLGELKKKGVEMVFLGAGKPIARIGTQNVQVGDVIDGFRIVDIRMDGTVSVEFIDDEK
ncbi:MAG: hypothetical protein IH991_09790 [Planctomycetes bacterium]|nr:hypothetical protein [Planctomycetota bacterium]